MKIAYIRTDFANKLKAGGSVAHMKGVIKAMRHLGHSVNFISTSTLTGLDAKETKVISPGILRYAIFGVGNAIYNLTSWPAFNRLIKKLKPDVIYHRYSLLSRVAIQLAKRYKIPLILEFNGSEVWVAKNWKIPLYSLKAVARNERYCLENAAVIVVVSQPIKNDLVKDGIPSQKILVNPNGADLDEYHPHLFTLGEKNALKKKLGISKDASVVGFIGTFGQWHGATDIVEAAHHLQEKGLLSDSVRFLMVGNGIMMPAVQEGIAKYKLEKWFVLPGMVGQQDAPRYLSLFDIALNPTTPNTDGSEFFGSPTKLFEYMAMSLAIISSRLGQMKDIFDDGIDSLLYEPKDVAGLAGAIATLLDDAKLRQKLGLNALKKVTATYTWEENVKRTLAALNLEP